ncbi:DUF5808 domain-containing protein [Atopobium sp. oral taxon 416]|uniref:DUF5808 domain-containing protein n=1 Tax=Atopobium sp. oral taxon 416 TaxID=712157 RepID=UPI001BA6AC4B|nr:DUF5808 domain-containing protein [Atopobium sp. oral taxon 416]QUC03411.1 hypothetical protein J4859_00040 [Atopobium sp. oral taxon 416]
MSSVSAIWLLCCWLPIPIWLTLRNSARFKKNIAVGVTLPREAQGDEQVTAILSGYRRWQLACAAALVTIALAGAVVGSVRTLAGPLAVCWSIWVLVACIAPEVVFALANARLAALKGERGWRHRGESGDQRITVADITTAAQPPMRTSNAWFLLSVAASLAPVLLDRGSLPVYLLSAVGALATWAIFRWCYRDRSEVVDANEALTQALTRIRRRAWGHVGLVAAASFALMSWLQLLFQGSPTLYLVSMVLLTAALVITSFAAEMRVRGLQERLTRGSGEGFYVDEDDHWVFGLLYFNPDDSSLMVNDRVGVGTSINFARPAGKAIAAALALALLCLPLTGVFIAEELSAPVTLELSGQTVRANHAMTDYEVAVGDVASVEVLDRLPDMTRTFGGSADTFLEGDFSSEEYGPLKVCLNPEAGPWLLVRTKDGTAYLLGANDPAQTTAALEELEANER